jgi:hypothetical protein
MLRAAFSELFDLHQLWCAVWTLLTAVRTENSIRRAKGLLQHNLPEAD